MIKTTLPIRRSPHIHERGFALIVTLSLMILLTIIAVGLLTLSSVSLRSSIQGEASAIARTNARMALVLAIGELQKHAGQDQRITATANIAGDAVGLPLAAGAQPLNDKSVSDSASTPDIKGLSAVQPGTRYWTGVFANKQTQTPGLAIFSKTPSPTIVHWLVSGNTTTYPAGGPDILPSNASCAIGSNGEVGDATKAVVLAGKSSVGAGADSTDRYVVAPLVQLIGKKSSNPVGRFGWWVGDEGVKAKINIRKSFDDKTNYAALTAQRRGWETVAGFDDPSAPYPASSAVAQESLPKIITLPAAELLLPGVGKKVGGTSPLQNVFHSATADSKALLTDSLNGGTKIDLTAVLSGDLPISNPVSSIINYPVKGANIIPIAAAPNIKAPKWDAIKDFHDRSKQLSGGSLIVKGATSEFTAAIAPVITDFRILMGARFKAKDAVSGTFNVLACGKIAVGIANPYSYPLKWTQDIEIKLLSQTPTGNNPSRIWGNLPTKPAYLPNSTSEAAVFQNAIFRIRASSLAPGEARAYTMATSLTRPAGSIANVTIDLTPFASSSPFDFNNCVQLDNATVYNPASLSNGRFELDVRESWQTTLAMVEMGLAGASSSTRLLRRIERFELDNGYFSPNQLRFTKAEAAAMTQPFPLMLYSFQISQPGSPYKDYMPAAYEMGQRGSTLRTFADFNLQATRIRKPIASYNPPPYFAESNNSSSQLSPFAPGGLTGPGFTRDLAFPRWGRSSKSGSEKTILFSIPSQFSTLAQLQHADLSGDDLGASIGHQPGNAVGNSYATPFVKRGVISQIRTSYELKGAPAQSGTNNSTTTYYDISHLLNSSLWDSYYFSTIPRSGSAIPENPTLVTLKPDEKPADLRDPVAAAPLLAIDGGFNLNSTDKNAWKAFLASAKHFKHAADSATNSDAAFPRGLEQVSPSASQPTGHDADSFSGFRRLTDAQLDALAGEIVKQVRLRGPFVSVSHFVNRALANLTNQPALSRSGALQSAIDESGANIAFGATKNGFTTIKASDDAVTLRWKDNAPRADYDGGKTGGRPADADPANPDWARTSTDTNYGSVASIIADREMLKDAKYIPEQGFRSTGIPGWLTQADVLQVIGASVTARSDTFRIRTFGEALDAGGKSIAKAYCEAIIQRSPAYVDPANPPTARGADLTPLNKTYGRQYQIVAFRWLSPQEI